MGSGLTPVRSRPYPLETDTPDVAADLHTLALNLDSSPIVSAGTLASRPAASVAGNRHMVQGDSTTAHNGQEWVDTGSGWVPVAPAVPPIGALLAWAGSGDPADVDGVTRWFVCDGRAISRTTYAALWTALSTLYGVGDGSTTFNIPDLRGRVPVGAGTGTGLTSRSLASSGGEETHILSTAEMPSHTHPVKGSGGYGGAWIRPGIGTPSASGSLGAIGSDTPFADSTGGGGAHNNMQPFLAVNHIIRVR
ncbi:MAG: phage tail protein [Mycobacteriaceae bacterium]